MRSSSHPSAQALQRRDPSFSSIPKGVEIFKVRSLLCPMSKESRSKGEESRLVNRLSCANPEVNPTVPHTTGAQNRFGIEDAVQIWLTDSQPRNLPCGRQIWHTDGKQGWSYTAVSRLDWKRSAALSTQPFLDNFRLSMTFNPVAIAASGGKDSDFHISQTKTKWALPSCSPIKASQHPHE